MQPSKEEIVKSMFLSNPMKDVLRMIGNPYKSQGWRQEVYWQEPSQPKEEEEKMIAYMERNQDAISQEINMHLPYKQYTLLTLLIDKNFTRTVKWVVENIKTLDPEFKPVDNDLSALHIAMMYRNIELERVLASHPKTHIPPVLEMSWHYNTEGQRQYIEERLEKIIALHPLEDAENVAKIKSYYILDRKCNFFEIAKEYCDDPHKARGKYRKKHGFNKQDSAALFVILRCVSCEYLEIKNA